MVKIFNEVNRITVVLDKINSSTQDFLIDWLKISYTDGVRCYKEPDKLTLTIFDNSEATMSFVKELISIGYGNTEIIEQDVVGLVPVSEKAEGIEITGTANKVANSSVLPIQYKNAGLTCEDALVKNGDEALHDMLSDVGLKFETEEEKKLFSNIFQCCKAYVLKKYGTLSNEDIFNIPAEEKKGFIQLFSDTLPDKVANILSRSSFATLDGFLENADDLMLGSAYAALTKELVNKFR